MPASFGLLSVGAMVKHRRKHVVKKQRREEAAQALAMLQDKASCYGLTLRTNRDDKPGSLAASHWMFERSGVRVLDYWPATGTVMSDGQRSSVRVPKPVPPLGQ